MPEETEKVESTTAVAEPEKTVVETPAVEESSPSTTKGLGEEEIFDMFGVSQSFEDTELADLAQGLQRNSGGEEKVEADPKSAEPKTEAPKEAEPKVVDEAGDETGDDELYVPRAQYMELLDRFEKQLGGEIGIPKLPEETATSDGAPSAQPQEATQVPEQPVAQTPLSVPLLDGYMISPDSEIAAQLGGDPEVVKALNTVTKENNRLLATHVTQQLQQGLYAQMVPAMVQLFPALMASAHLCEMAPQMESHPKLAHLIIEDEARKNPELVNRPRQLAQKALERLNIEIPKGERRAKQAQDNRTAHKGPGRFATKGTPASNRDSGEKPKLSIDQQIDQSIAGGVVGAEFMDEL